ncbi:MAG: hypothetical protein KF760_10770 [Candidatus Eremiobacteraeota bacterium]|nr:hypothetical protein [Candidatus Eremiobacteraeota bacterium]
METIVALVILTGSLLLVTALLNRSNRYQQRSESLLEAAALADKVMADIRVWARTPANYSGSWGAWDGRLLSEPDFPGLQARVDIKVENQKILSPDNPTELAFSAPREMEKGSVTVRIQAARDVTSPVGRIIIWTLIAPPTPNTTAGDPHVVVTSPLGTPMAVGESRAFTAEAFDGAGRKLPPCCFEWRVRSGTGRANSGGQSRDGRSYSISHTDTRENDLGVIEPSAGDVSVEADARIMGKIWTGSLGVTLEPGP